jgi:hypothetical protein
MDEDVMTIVREALAAAAVDPAALLLPLEDDPNMRSDR